MSRLDLRGFVVGLIVGAVLVAAAYVVSPAAASEELERATRAETRVTALVEQIKRERAARPAEVRRAYQAGRRSILVQTNTEHLVRMVAIAFGHDPDRAVQRAKCESGHAMSPTAGNGQYVGVYQLGTAKPGGMWHRAGMDFIAAGIGPTDALANILVAHRYAARHGWREWQCGNWSAK